MSAAHGNEPAFPVNELHQITEGIAAQHFGLSLRDYFAAMAMQLQPWHDPDDNYDNHANRCYVMADAMLEARK